MSNLSHLTKKQRTAKISECNGRSYHATYEDAYLKAKNESRMMLHRLEWGRIYQCSFCKGWHWSNL
jgi:hypothetical protein